jgi:hypothetical protein
MTARTFRKVVLIALWLYFVSQVVSTIRLAQLM